LFSTTIMFAFASVVSAEPLLTDLEKHPRPTFARPWESLDGPWQFKFDPNDHGVRDSWFSNPQFSKTIRVPFPWQSELSGIGDTKYQGVAWYSKEIVAPTDLPGDRVFLVFGAVDWEATVWINGQRAGFHEGGYTPFDVELTKYAKKGDRVLVVVRVLDKTDPETPNGKQTGWYTPSGGIWQSVYLEGRGDSFVTESRVYPDIDEGVARVEYAVSVAAKGTYELRIEARNGTMSYFGKETFRAEPGVHHGSTLIPIPRAKLWTPDSPDLYWTTIALHSKGDAIDEVRTYFGMRKISRGTYDGSEHEYILLNNKPIYLRGALHQSFNPQGVHTHPDDAYIRRDYEKAKEFGLNFLRIHIKVDEPRALYWADKLGVLLMCDMPCFNKKTDRAKALWEATMRETITRDFNNPSVFAWCDFNETWGIRDGGYDRPTQEWVRDMYHLTKQLDPTRLVEDNSPCYYDHVESDINSWHFYSNDYSWCKDHIADVVKQTFPGSKFNCAEGWAQGTAPLINSEYGGISAGSGDADISWCFVYLTNLLRKYGKICGYVYTELEDIEWEHNGFMNYDRSPKEYHYPGGITLAELQGEEFPVLDCPPYQTARPGETVQIPVLLSHWSEREGLTVRISATGQSVDGKDWSELIQAKEFAFSGRPFGVSPAGEFEFTAPDASGLVSIVAEVLASGRRIAANFCVVHVLSGKSWIDEGLYAVSFPVNAYSNLRFEQSETFANEYPGKVAGFGAGFVEYTLQFPSDLRAESLDRVSLYVEAGSRARSERLDWPGRRHAKDYPQTDDKVWPTDIRITVDGVEAATIHPGNDYADGRGVLSHVNGIDLGSRGEIHKVELPRSALDALVKAQKSKDSVRVRFEVPAGTAHPGGLSLYGKELGSWPSDPTFVFTLKSGVAKPKGSLRVLDSVTSRRVQIIKPGPKGTQWRYTETAPPTDTWTDANFDDSRWRRGTGGFGNEGTPGIHIGTAWRSPEIWMRTKVRLPKNFDSAGIWLDLFHDENVEVYVNGKRLLRERRYLTDYRRVALDTNQATLFTPGGECTIAVHCENSTGGQGVDLGLTILPSEGARRK
jgi:hypothetical protein